MKVFTVERTVVTKIRQEITASSKREALEIADEVVTFSMIGADDYTTTDRVIGTREVDGNFSESDPDYLGWNNKAIRWQEFRTEMAQAREKMKVYTVERLASA